MSFQGSGGWRRITVDGARHHWILRHVHGLALPGEASPPAGCRYVFIADLAACRRARFHVWVPGDAEGAFVSRGSFYGGTPAREVDLCRPAVAAAIIRLARAEGWDPERDPSPRVVEGTSFLARLAAIAPPRGAS